MNRRSPRWPRIGAGIVAAALLVVAAVLLAAVYRPLPLGFLSSAVESRIDSWIAPLRLVTAELRSQWKPAGPSLILLGERVSLIDRDGRKVATVPKGRAVFSLRSFVIGKPDLLELHLDRPSFAVLRGKDGMIRIGLGAFDPSSAGEAMVPIGNLEALEQMLVCCIGSDFPDLSVTDGQVHYSDALTGARLQFDDLEASLRPSVDRLPFQLSVAQMVGDQPLRFTAHVDRYRPGAGMAIVIQPEDVYPAILGEALPHSGFLRPFEIPISGALTLRLGADRSLTGIGFNLVGGAGSLEVAEFNADNLYVEYLSVRGAFDAGTGVFELDDGFVRFADGDLVIKGSVHPIYNGFRISLQAHLTDVRLAELLPRWFAGLHAALRTEAAGSGTPTSTILQLTGTIRPGEGEIESSGTIRLEEQDGDGPNSVQTLSFVLEGPLTAPGLTVRAPGP